MHNWHEMTQKKPPFLTFSFITMMKEKVRKKETVWRQRGGGSVVVRGCFAASGTGGLHCIVHSNLEIRELSSRSIASRRTRRSKTWFEVKMMGLLARQRDKVHIQKRAGFEMARSILNLLKIFGMSSNLSLVKGSLQTFHKEGEGENTVWEV